MTLDGSIHVVPDPDRTLVSNERPYPPFASWGGLDWLPGMNVSYAMCANALLRQRPPWKVPATAQQGTRCARYRSKSPTILVSQPHF